MATIYIIIIVKTLYMSNILVIWQRENTIKI